MNCADLVSYISVISIINVHFSLVQVFFISLIIFVSPFNPKLPSFNRLYLFGGTLFSNSTVYAVLDKKYNLSLMLVIYFDTFTIDWASTGSIFLYL